MAAAVASAPGLGLGVPSRTPIATASGLLALLSEPDPSLVRRALSGLLSVVDTLWHEVAESLPDLEAIAEGGEGYESHDAPTRETAAALASRVFFHLEEPRQALRLALGSGGHFDVMAPAERDGPYVERLVNAAIEEYVSRRAKEFDGEDAKADGEDEGEEELDAEKLTRVVHLMFERCYADGSHGHALGVAFEGREAGRVAEVLSRLSSSGLPAPEVVSVLNGALKTASDLIPSKAFRSEALGLIGGSLHDVFGDVSAPEPARRSAACALALCRQLLDDAAAVSSIVTSLIDGGDDQGLLGLQLCFDLVDSGDQAFASAVASGLPSRDGGAEVDAGEEGVEVAAPRSDATWTRFDNARRVLTGGFTSELSLSFLYKNSDADPLIMSNLKGSLDERTMSRNSVLHNCAVTAHGYLNAGTTNDAFLRDNLDWMKKAANWAKFSATASMGVVHAGHTTEAMTLLEPYLPAGGGTDGGDDAGDDADFPAVSASGGYAEGGAMYALGLIHGSRAGSSVEKRLAAGSYLRRHLRNSHANEVISHGAAMGAGLAHLGSCDLGVVSELKELLYTDSAVAGEAAGYAMGMVLVGSGAGNAGSPPGRIANKDELDEVVAELRNYSRETHHEKIIRGIAMCLALVNFGQEDNADATVEEMRGDRDPIIRYGAMYALALAYCGTGSNKAVRILLHTAVSDVNDDVRMASVIGLAFVLHKTPERVPEIVRLLLESFNPHVRYASCMAVGIAMAGTGDSEAVSLLEPMLSDMADHVRQGALLGTAMIYMQQSDGCNRRGAKSFRDKLAGLVADKHQTTLTKMGAILATGLIDAGGRNCSLSLGSRGGFTKMTSAAGLALWLQHWYWYPLMHTLSLALTPTCTIGLNGDFMYPKRFEVVCDSRPSAFAYPRKLEEKKEEAKKRVETVALSATAKNKARLARKKAKEEGESGGGAGGDMDVDAKDETKPAAAEDGKEEEKKDGDGMDVDGAKPEEGDAAAASSAGGGAKKKKKKEPEPTSFRVGNPARVTSSQSSHCRYDLGQRYRPVRPDGPPSGVIMLTDSEPGEDDAELGAVRTPAQEEEADPPLAFEWAPPGHPEHPDAVAAAAGGSGEEEAKEGDEGETKDDGDDAMATE